MLRSVLRTLLLLVGLKVPLTHGLRYDPAFEGYNLNQNKTATNPLDYWGQWEDHKYNPSPDNWRFPIYTLFLDRLANGDPTNDDINGTLFEHDLYSTQLRHGGDLDGLLDSLDYIQGMGIKGLYIAGSPFINLPWSSDNYSPVDHTLLDLHFGNISKWRETITEIHRRNMYVILDNTVATMSDLLGFEGYMNDTAPFVPHEMAVKYKGPRRYHDFEPGHKYKESCAWPRLWSEDGFLIKQKDKDQFKGCYDGEFDQMGDTEAFGVHPDYRRQMTKFASVQDRLREWVPSVREKIQHFSCIAIAMLDIDGFRYDKATQVTIDAEAAFSAHLRDCARKHGKQNFFIAGEITGGNTFGSLYLGRGRQPDQYIKNLTVAASLTPDTGAGDGVVYLRDVGQNALDAAAFHYSTYRYLTRFLNMDGNLEAGYDVPPSWVEGWNQMLLTNDFLNPNTGKVDPRHMYGVSNQDVFRWPAVRQGIERMLLGHCLMTLLMPGIPKLLWGEEQGFHVLDSTNDNYIYGRQAMTSSPAWYLHGCYAGGSTQYFDFPLEAALVGCHDEKQSWDHRDPSHPVHNIIKAMYALRRHFPVLSDGWFLQQLSNQTKLVQYPGSNGTKTETGMWSVMRSAFASVQNLGDTPSIWFVYSNHNESTTYQFDCADPKRAFISPFDSGTTVKNLLFPHDEIKLVDSSTKLGINGSTKFNGCSPQLEMEPYDWRIYVPSNYFVPPPPMITKFIPGHDAKISATGPIRIKIEIHLSVEMDCGGFVRSLVFTSSTESGSKPEVEASTINCKAVSILERAPYIGAVSSAWSWSAELKNVEPGIHKITVKNATTADLGDFTNSVDHFFIRVGADDNPIVFPSFANYSANLLSRDDKGGLVVNHKAAGADMWRYSTNWASSWSPWTEYKGGSTPIATLPWNGTKKQEWEGAHVQVQYYSKILSSSSFLQHGDVDFPRLRRWPHLYANGLFNQFGFDAGSDNELRHVADSRWEWHFMYEWPTRFQLNVWGMNPDDQPDQSFVYGDIDGDHVLDRMPPSSLVENAVNITKPPPRPYLAFKLLVDDASFRYELVPVGNMWQQLGLYIILWILPVVGGSIVVLSFKGSFYKVKFVVMGLNGMHTTLRDHLHNAKVAVLGLFKREKRSTALSEKRRTVLIATMEYNIDDWNIKIKIGGLGVMGQLMSKVLKHQNIIWVVPCVGDIDYPIDRPAPSMNVKILGQDYDILVQYHQLENVTFVLLDAPIFRKQTKAEPYPPRMDDMESAIYYSAWNQCIAETTRRFPIDLYHINDYHGAVALLHILPRTIPACLSLHNAEFQGMWPMRTPEEHKEVCEVFNLDPEIVEKYVQFGSVFNLLHAGASYLRVHQKGFGAVGVSKKYGARSFARYPVFWGLTRIGQLPNPDPSDTGAWDKDAFMSDTTVSIDPAFEAGRGDLKRQAQEWAGLEVNPDADLFVFVGRWSLQKGVDLIADLFPLILEQHPNTQLMCIGPVIDLYGKFAALKLAKLMEKYPSRVFSKPEFTALPPYIFSGAEFALIPSRDEPFGLVAVEFGRKGALGVGARVGGLGNMPGWWYTVESTSAAHLLAQFKEAIESALETKQETRALMRAWSAKQRFPVAQWLEDLEKLQVSSIQIHDKVRNKPHKLTRLGHHGKPTHLTPTYQAVTDVDGGDESDLESPGASPSPFGPSSGFDAQRAPGASSGPSSLPGPGFAMSHGATELDYLSPPRASFLGDGGSSGGNSLYASASGNASTLSLDTVVGDRHDFALQKTEPFFEDSRGEYYQAFEKKLEALDADNSMTELCIEDYLVRSEKDWFAWYRNVKLGRPSMQSHRPLSEALSTRSPRPKSPRPRSPQPTRDSFGNIEDDSQEAISLRDFNEKEHFGLGDDYVPPTGLKKHLQRRIRDWPIYGILIAVGQVISSNSYQITLLTGEIGQTATKLYVVVSIYLVGTLLWYALSRFVPSFYTISVPFFFYGTAFALLGISPFVTDTDSTARTWIQNVATGTYAIASASGGLSFAFNFGDEGGSPVETWIYRATVIQGAQQIYSLGLWWWGSLISAASAEGAIDGEAPKYTIASSPWILAVCGPMTIILWMTGVALFLGLPDYYRQIPGKVPTLWRSLFRRKTIVWYFGAVIVQNYFLSAPYGRNWFFLFSSEHVPTWAIVLLAIGFLAIAWSIILYWLSIVSREHPWLFPLFAVGLGAPRWAQMFWGTSNIGMYLPWAGGPVLSTILSRSLWLWLGLLDGIQGAGIGMILMLTLTRVHVASTVVAAQVMGSIATMVGRATAPNNLGPGDVFPDLSRGLSFVTSKGWFWAGLLSQLLICVGFLKFFRKEQVSKP